MSYRLITQSLSLFFPVRFYQIDNQPYYGDTYNYSQNCYNHVYTTREDNRVTMGMTKTVFREVNGYSEEVIYCRNLLNFSRLR